MSLSLIDVFPIFFYPVTAPPTLVLDSRILYWYPMPLKKQLTRRGFQLRDTVLTLEIERYFRSPEPYGRTYVVVRGSSQTWEFSDYAGPFRDRLKESEHEAFQALVACVTEQQSYFQRRINRIETRIQEREKFKELLYEKR